METITSSQKLKELITSNPNLHTISRQGECVMENAYLEYDFDIDESDPNYRELDNNSLSMGFLYIYDNEEDLTTDLNNILLDLDLIEGCDDQYYDYNPDALEMVIYGAYVSGQTDNYAPLIRQKCQKYLTDFDALPEDEQPEFMDEYKNLATEENPAIGEYYNAPELIKVLTK